MWKNSSGTILIVTLWMLVILTVFAIALGQRVSLEAKLVEYQRDKLRAMELAKAAIERAIYEKLNYEKLDEAVDGVDALNEPWANNETAFKDIELGDQAFGGRFTVSYSIGGQRLYGLQDEQGKININKVDEAVLLKLLENREVENAERLAHSIAVWCKTTDDDSEDDNYADLPYSCKKEKCRSISELLLVRYGELEDEGMTPGILYGEDKDEDGQLSEDEQGLARYLTVYSSNEEGRVNINTAPEEVLQALIDNPDLVEAILDYRKGADGEISQIEDNNWFKVDENGNFSASDFFFFESLGGSGGALETLKNTGKFSARSNIYTVYAQAEVERVRKSIIATIKIDSANPDQITYLFWCRN